MSSKENKPESTGDAAHLGNALVKMSRRWETSFDDLKSAHDYMNNLVDSIEEGLIVIDTDYRITNINRSALALAGRDYHDVLFGPCKAACLCEGAREDCPASRVFQEKQTCRAEFCVRSDERSPRWFEINFSPLFDSRGEVVEVVEVIRDITHRRELEQKLMHNDRLNAMGQLAAGVAHEVRNLLTSAKMLLQMDVEAANLTGAQKEHLTVAAESITGMEQKIEELLAFAKPSPMKIQSLNVNELVALIVNQVKPVAEDSKVAFELINLAGEAQVLLDVEKTRAALVNLLLNAIQAAGKGGTARFTVSWSGSPEQDESAKAIECLYPDKVNPLARFLQFAVDDTGPGVAPDIRRQVFEPFFTTRARGTGLGLATVNQIVKDYGGSISIEESVLGGARFVIIIPA